MERLSRDHSTVSPLFATLRHCVKFPNPMTEVLIANIVPESSNPPADSARQPPLVRFQSSSVNLG